MITKQKKDKKAIYLYLAILLLFGVSIAFAASYSYKSFKKHFNAGFENQLRQVADSKVNELNRWRKERESDAAALLGNAVFSEYIKIYFLNPSDLATKRKIEVWMRQFQVSAGYNAVFLTDSNFIKKIIIPEVPERPVAFVDPKIIDSLKSGKMVFEDFYKDDFKDRIFLKLQIPVLVDNKFLGMVELRIDPETYLYPSLNELLLPAKSYEIVLLKQEGNEAVCLNETRLQKNAALNFRVPLTNLNSPLVQAVIGYKGFNESVNYRGAAVVSYIQEIPESPWYIIVQVNSDEAYVPLKEKRNEILVLVFAAFIIVGLGLLFAWKVQQTLYLSERIKSAEALRESEEHFRSLYENSAMGIYRTTPDGKIILANNTLINMLGYLSYEDLCSRAIEKEGYPPTYDRKQFIDRIEKSGEVIGFEAEWRKKDGTPVFIRESSKAIRGSDHSTLYYDGTVEDITDLKKSELERRVIFEITQGIATTDNINELLKLIHHSLAKVIYAENIFIALYDQDTELFEFPYWVDQFDPIPEADAMRKSLSSNVFRTGKPLLFSQELFQELKDQNGVNLVGSPSPSWVGVPLQTPERTIGVLVLQHYEKENVYSEQDVQFLVSVGSQAALVIERKRAEEKLRKERLLLRIVIDNIPDSIYCKDSAYRKTLANRTELSYSGAFSEADVLGKTDFELYPKEIAEGIFADDQTVMQSEQPILNRIESVVDAKGQTHWLLTSKLPMKDEYGNIIGLVGIGRDITEARQANADLRESETKLNVILQSTADGILAVDGNGKVIKTNNRFAELWRIPQPLIDSGDDEALIAFVLDQLTNPDEFIAKVQKLYHTTDEDLDHLYFKDGRTFERFSAPLILPDSSIGRVWSFRDISEARQAMADLQESEIKLNVILQSTADGILAVDTNGKIIRVNKRLTELWQIPQSIIDEGDDNTLMHHVLNQVSNGFDFISIIKKVNSSLEEYQDIVHFKDGHIFERYSAPMVMDNALVGRVWSFRDITTRTLDEERLRRSEKQFRSVLESVSLIGLMLDVEGKIILCNDFLLNLTGWTRQEVLFGSWFDLFLPEEIQYEEQINLFQSALHQGEIQAHYENEIVTRSGEKRLIAWSNIIMHDHLGVVTGMASIGEDITDRKKAEEEIKLKNEELLKINSEKDKFFSIIAHDLRSPFNGFLGLTRIMAEGLPGFKADDLQKLAVRMQNSATNLFRLLENLLHWSQMQQGIFPFNPSATRLLPVVNEIISLAEESANSKNISISNDIPSDLNVFADNAMLQTVIRNLLSNALKFTHMGGKISISAKVENEKFVAISVMDSGIGMDTEMLNNLFSLNAQTNRKGTEKESSSGLGLLLCKEFVEKQGGKLWVESEVSKGSTFFFTLPSNANKQEKTSIEVAVAADIATDQIKKLKILIAEDDETSNTLFSIALSYMSRDLLYSKTGLEAVDVCRNNPDTDLILMDIQMPGMDGYEATRQIRLFNKDIVIFAQTAFGFMGEKQKSIEAGCNEYITKPIDINLLKGLLLKHFKKK